MHISFKTTHLSSGRIKIEHALGAFQFFLLYLLFVNLFSRIKILLLKSCKHPNGNVERSVFGMKIFFIEEHSPFDGIFCFVFLSILISKQFIRDCGSDFILQIFHSTVPMKR